MKTILLTALFYLLCGYPLSVSAQVAEADSIVRLPRSVSFLKNDGLLACRSRWGQSGCLGHRSVYLEVGLLKDQR